MPAEVETGPTRRTGRCCAVPSSTCSRRTRGSSGSPSAARCSSSAWADSPAYAAGVPRGASSSLLVGTQGRDRRDRLDGAGACSPSADCAAPTVAAGVLLLLTGVLLAAEFARQLLTAKPTARPGVADATAAEHSASAAVAPATADGVTVSEGRARADRPRYAAARSSPSARRSSPASSRSRWRRAAPRAPSPCTSRPVPPYFPVPSASPSTRCSGHAKSAKYRRPERAPHRVADHRRRETGEQNPPARPALERRLRPPGPAGRSPSRTTTVPGQRRTESYAVRSRSTAAPSRRLVVPAHAVLWPRARTPSIAMRRAAPSSATSASGRRCRPVRCPQPFVPPS